VRTESVQQGSLYLLMSFRDTPASRLQSLALEAVDTGRALELNTLGFSNVFSRVFGAVGRSGEPATITYMRQRLTIREAYVFFSGKEKLDGSEGDDHVVVLRADGVLPPAEIAHIIDHVRTSERINEQDAVHLLEEAARDTPCGDLLAALECEFPAIQVWDSTGIEVDHDTVAFMAAFYFYGWLTVQRLERAQVAVKLAGTAREVEEGLATIGAQRARVVNLNRYFLTTNRSTLDGVKNLCRTLVRRFGLREKYRRHLDVHVSLEQHLNNVSSLAQNQRSRRLNQTVAGLTVVAVPAGIVSALMALSVSADLVRRPGTLLSSPRMTILLLASLVVPLLMLTVALVLDRIAVSRMNRRSARD
jgi:hypothetical protein